MHISPPPGGPLPNVTPWSWDDVFHLDGVDYRAQWFDPLDTLASQFQRMGIIRDLPPRFLDTLLVAAQTSEAPHGWRVGPVLRSEDVDPTILTRARDLFFADLERTRARFVTFIAEDRSGVPTVLGCAAARRFMSPTYESAYWVALTRLLAVPEFRGVGLGRFFNIAFFASSQTYFERPVLGCFLPTDSEQVRRLARRAIEQGVLEMVQTGGKIIAVPDAVFEVEVFLSFYSGMRDWVIDVVHTARSTNPPNEGILELLDMVELAWRQGYTIPEGKLVGDLFRRHESALLQHAQSHAAFVPAYDFLAAARALGTFDGVGVEGRP